MGTWENLGKVHCGNPGLAPLCSAPPQEEGAPVTKMSTEAMHSLLLAFVLELFPSLLLFLGAKLCNLCFIYFSYFSLSLSLDHILC